MVWKRDRKNKRGIVRGRKEERRRRRKGIERGGVDGEEV